MRTLRYKGEVVSQSVRVIDGRPWVPLSDAARLVGGRAVRVGGGYQIQAGMSTQSPR